MILACRDITKAERAASDIRRAANTNNVVVKVIDLSNMQSIRNFCRDINAHEKEVNILINNAGVL